MEEFPSGGPPPHLSQDFPLLPPSLRSTAASLSTPNPSKGLLPTPPSAPLPTTIPPPSAPPSSTLPPPSTSTPLPSLWTDLFTRASTIPKNFPPPKISSDGIPIVKAPPSILLKSSETWKDFIICSFFGEPPPLKKIFSDLNPIWGKKGTIQIKPYSPRSCLILIPDVPMRDWVLDIGFWSAGTVAFSTTLWTPTATLSTQSLSSAPVWLVLHNIPPQLWSLEGFEIIASGVGDPLPSKKLSTVPALGRGLPRVRAIVPLDQGPLPQTVLVEDDDGNQVPVEIQYINLPPLCPSCSKYGHRAHRCHLRPRVPAPSKTLAPSTKSSTVRTPTPAAAKSVHSEGLNMGPSLESLGFSSGLNFTNGPNSSSGLNTSTDPPSAPLQIESGPNSTSAHPSSSPSVSTSLPLGPSSTTQAQSSTPKSLSPENMDLAIGPASTTQAASSDSTIHPPSSANNSGHSPPSDLVVSPTLPIQSTFTNRSDQSASANPPDESVLNNPPVQTTTDINSSQPLTITTLNSPSLSSPTSSPSDTTSPHQCHSSSPYATPTDYTTSPLQPPFTSPHISSFTSLLRQLEDNCSPSSGNLGPPVQNPSTPYSLPTLTHTSPISSTTIHNPNHIIFEDAEEEDLSDHDHEPTDELEDGEIADYDHSNDHHQDIDSFSRSINVKGGKGSKKKRKSKNKDKKQKEHLKTLLPPFFPVSRRLL